GGTSPRRPRRHVGRYRREAAAATTTRWPHRCYDHAAAPATTWGGARPTTTTRRPHRHYDQVTPRRRDRAATSAGTTRSHVVAATMRPRLPPPAGCRADHHGQWPRRRYDQVATT
ncbi:hypothetical protein, partial [Streptomyces sp. NPDC021969]|uniref:hypothetical protein n=2 Tax=unclassified Streptomyces TaxID=2593676 RepID=UPI0034033FE9